MAEVARNLGTFIFHEETAPEELPPFPGDPDIQPPDAPRFMGPPADIISQVPILSEFPESWKADYSGLLLLGYLEDVVDDIPFHHFIVRTLTVGEKIEISRITRDLEGMLGFNRAYKAAVVAAGLVMVDGQAVLNTQKKKSSVREKYEYVISEWRDIVVDKLYSKINELELQAVQIAYELGMVDAPPVFLTNQAVQQELERQAAED